MSLVTVVILILIFIFYSHFVGITLPAWIKDQPMTGLRLCIKREPIIRSPPSADWSKCRLEKSVQSSSFFEVGLVYLLSAKPSHISSVGVASQFVRMHKECLAPSFPRLSQFCLRLALQSPHLGPQPQATGATGFSTVSTTCIDNTAEHGFLSSTQIKPTLQAAKSLTFKTSLALMKLPPRQIGSEGWGIAPQARKL